MQKCHRAKVTLHSKITLGKSDSTCKIDAIHKCIRAKMTLHTKFFFCVKVTQSAKLTLYKNVFVQK